MAAAAALAFWRAPPFWPLLAVALAQAAALAPLVPLSDRLALAGALPRGAGPGDRPFDYGWVRGAGSLAFIGGSVLAGQAVDRLGLPVVLALSAPLLLAGALAALRVPRLHRGPAPNTAVASVGAKGAIGALFQLPAFRRLVLVAALILGSHAFHDSFAVITWRAAGMTTGTAGLLWSESVAAEVLIFVALGPPLLERMGAARAAAVAAVAGVVRWSVMAVTASVPAMVAVEPLHGLTFALLHLACMRILAAIVPARLAATALALYGTVAIGAATAALTLVAGPLYVWIGAGGFWVMAGLAAIALPLARGLGTDPGATDHGVSARARKMMPRATKNSDAP